MIRPLFRIPLGLLAGFALLLVMVTGGLLFARQQARHAESQQQLFVAGRATAELLNALRDAETAQRGYLLTGDARYLEPYVGAAPRVRRALATLTEAGRDVRVLRRLSFDKLDELSRTVALARDGDPARAIEIVRSGVGRVAMSRIRIIAAGFIAQTRAALQANVQAARQGALALTVALLIGMVGVIATALVTFRHSRTQFRLVAEERDRANTALAQLTAEAAAREQAEAQLRQVQKMESIGQLTGGIAHDFNNMLAIVIGSLDMAERRRGDPERLQRCLSAAREGADRAAMLTQRLLAFARRQPLAPAPIDVNRLVGGISGLLRRTLGERIAVETILSGGMWTAHADPTQLESAILNLAVNARDAMPDGGRLTIETGNAALDESYADANGDVRPGQYVAVSISDTGAGMPAEVRARAFDPFFTTKPPGRGTGLGLSQVFGFVKQTGGHVAIYSELGRGTTVRLYLPRFHGAPIYPLAEEPQRDLPMGRAGERILVVEDEERVRQFSVETLRELGYEVMSAPSGGQALDLLATAPAIALLFTDVVMPGMNGKQLADAVQAARPGLPVLYTTGYTRNAIIHNGMLDPGVALLQKPFTIAQLATRVRAVIDASEDDTTTRVGMAEIGAASGNATDANA